MTPLSPLANFCQIFINSVFLVDVNFSQNSLSHKCKKSSNFVCETQITIENTTIWFPLYCLKVFVERTWKITGIHIGNNRKSQLIIACNYFNLISFKFTFQCFHIFSPSRIFFVLLKSTFTKLLSPTQCLVNFYQLFSKVPPPLLVDINYEQSNTCNCKLPA